VKSNPLPLIQAVNFAKAKSIEFGVMIYISRQDGKTSKYKAVKCALNGVVYDSIKEAKYAAQLDIMQKCHVVLTIKRQVSFDFSSVYTVDGRSTKPKAARWIADFVVGYSDGHTDYVDVKGVRTPDYKRKKKIIEELYNIKISEV
jgi:hypothetical protein